MLTDLFVENFRAVKIMSTPAYRISQLKITKPLKFHSPVIKLHKAERTDRSKPYTPPCSVRFHCPGIGFVGVHRLTMLARWKLTA